MIQNLRGCYLSFEHDRQADWDFLHEWEPSVIHLMIDGSHTDPASVSIPRIRRVYDTSPAATILLRCWDVDDRRDPNKPGQDAHAAMQRDPIAEADKQIDWWAHVFDACAAAGIPRDSLMAGLNNETPPSMDASLNPYTIRALHRATALAMRLGVGVFSVGRPGKPGEGLYDMTFFAQQWELLIKANRGALLCNEYMQPEGMYAVWTDETGQERHDWLNLMGRHKHWPMSVPIIIGEWGIDGLLWNRHADPVYGHSGWLNFKPLWPPTRLGDEYVEYGRQASPLVIGVCQFKSDWGKDKTWQSFDAMPAYAAFVERKALCVKEVPSAPGAPGGSTIHLPDISTGPTEPSSTPDSPPPPPPAPTSTTAIDPLVAQAILAIESGGRAFGPGNRPMIRFEAHIFREKLQNDALWSQYFQTDPQKPWTNQEWRPRPDAPWRPIHINAQAEEYTVFELAKQLNAEAAYQSLGMGIAQTMGFNHERLGYPSAQAMYESFQDAAMQTLAFFNYVVTEPALMQAVHTRDWRTIAELYNGSGAVDSYSQQLADKYRALGGVT